MTTPGPSKTADQWVPLRYRRQVRALKRAAVLLTAAEAFCEKGFHGTSLDEIAARLNVSKPTLYYYFKSKQDILYESVRNGLAILGKAIDAFAQSGESGREVLVRVMHKYVELSLNAFGRCALQMGQDPLTPRSRARLRKLERGVALKMRAVVERGVLDGSIPPCDPRVVVSNITGALSWIARWYRPDGVLKPQEIATQCIASLMAGIAPRPGPLPRPRMPRAARRGAAARVAA